MQLEMKNVSFSYEKKQPVLKNVSLTVEKGEFIGIMGRTGSGKTTLVTVLAGLKKPLSGQVLFEGENINSPSYKKTKLRKKTAMVFQYPEYQLFESTVKKDVEFAPKQFGIENASGKAKNALERAGFNYESIKDKSPFSLSGGEKRRVAVAGAVASDPEILIFDEPLSGLDGQGREDFMELMRELHKKGKTIIIVSHCTDVLSSYADRIIYMEEGIKAFDGRAEDFFLSEKAFVKTAARETAEMAGLRGIYKKDELIEAVLRLAGGKNSE